MRALLLCLVAVVLFGEEVFLIDGTQKTALVKVPSPKISAEAVAALPHIRRDSATITLQYEGEEYNHRHFNVRLATLEAHPVYTVLTEYSEQVAPDAHRITFSGYCYYEARMLQVYYDGRWFAALLEPLEQQGAEQADGTAENAAPDNEPSKVLSYEALDHLLDELGR